MSFITTCVFIYLFSFFSPSPNFLSCLCGCSVSPWLLWESCFRQRTIHLKNSSQPQSSLWVIQAAHDDLWPTELQGVRQSVGKNSPNKYLSFTPPAGSVCLNQVLDHTTGISWVRSLEDHSFMTILGSSVKCGWTKLDVVFLLSSMKTYFEVRWDQHVHHNV